MADEGLVKSYTMFGSVPITNNTPPPKEIEDLDESHPAWSTWLEKRFGRVTAGSFAYATDLILGYADEELGQLAARSRGTHVGQIKDSWFADALPAQFLTRYDYEFLYLFADAVMRLRAKAASGDRIGVHCVFDELALAVVADTASTYIEFADLLPNVHDECPKGLLFEICGNKEIEKLIYGPHYAVRPGYRYHFDRWFEKDDESEAEEGERSLQHWLRS